MKRPAQDRHWKLLLAMAEEEVGRTLTSLPSPVRRRAAGLPVTYEAYPGDAIVADGFDPDLLGLFVGNAINASFESDETLPAQIILFLESLWDYSDGDEAIYREEVRRTYLHELGHYLGLDEEDLADRDLD